MLAAVKDASTTTDDRQRSSPSKSDTQPEPTSLMLLFFGAGCRDRATGELGIERSRIPARGKAECVAAKGTTAEPLLYVQHSLNEQ